MPFDSHNNRLFQSTLSVRRATLRECLLLLIRLISIHALRKESDFALLGKWNCPFDFNPRSP